MTTRPDPPLHGDERELLLGWLAFHRATLALKCQGLSAEQLADMAVLPSRMSLLGLVRHLSEIERSYFRNGFGGEALPLIYYTDADPDADFEGVTQADPDVSLAAWHEERQRADEIIAGVGSGSV